VPEPAAPATLHINTASIVTTLCPTHAVLPYTPQAATSRHQAHYLSATSMYSRGSLLSFLSSSWYFARAASSWRFRRFLRIWMRKSAALTVASCSCTAAAHIGINYR
jgi:hypothetical protein